MRGRKEKEKFWNLLMCCQHSREFLKDSQKRNFFPKKRTGTQAEEGAPALVPVMLASDWLLVFRTRNGHQERPFLHHRNSGWCITPRLARPVVPSRDLGVPFLVAFGLVPKGTRLNATRNATSFLERHHRPSSSWCSKTCTSRCDV